MNRRPPLFIPCVALFGVSGALVAAVLTVRLLAWRDGPEGLRIAPPTGVTISQVFVPPAEAIRPPCHLVRFARRSCHWCAPRLSGPYNGLEAEALRSGCDSFVVLPGQDDLPPDSPGAASEITLRAVSYDFAASISFSGTPSTLLADRNWKILWFQTGVLSPKRAAEAMARLQKYLNQ